MKKRIIFEIIAAVLIVCCIVASVAVLSNRSDASPENAGNAQPAEKAPAEAEKPVIADASLSERNRIENVAKAIADEPITYVPATSYDWQSERAAAFEEHPNNSMARVSYFQLDEERLAGMTTEELCEYALNLPFTNEHFAISDCSTRRYDYFYDYLVKTYNCYAELDSRADAAHYLLKKYLNSPHEGEDGNIFDTRNIEIILSRASVFGKLTDDEVKVFAARFDRNIAERDASGTVSNGFNTLLTDNAETIARYKSACDAIGLEAPDMTQLTVARAGN